MQIFRLTAVVSCFRAIFATRVFATRVFATSLFAISSFALSSFARAADLPFSGPQVGEALVPFEAQTVFGAGEKVNALDGKGDGKGDSPTLLVFVHQITRPSIGVLRLVLNYATTKEQQGLKSHLVFLSDDPTETEAILRRARGALPQGVTPLISTDGIEGPGVG